ncbi:hypothetical protein ACIKTA_18590, partial [Hansschlegelia beijingensis]
ARYLNNDLLFPTFTATISAFEEGMPSLPGIGLVLLRRPAGVSDAAEHLAQFISRALPSAAPFRPSVREG